jgi:hypothetical protein
MHHFPVALLLACCAFLAVAYAQTSCDVRQEYFKGFGCGDRSSCLYGSLNETECAVFTVPGVGDHYSALVNCTTKVLSLYNNANCTGVAATLKEGGCLSASVSLSASFDSTCSSAALVQSWVSFLFF